MSDFPSSKFERGKIFAKTGVKVGTNYAKRFLKEKVAGKTEDKSRFYAKNANDIYDEFIKLRGTALKIAQGMSMNPGFLPEEFSEVMAKAQYSVPPINKALVRSIIKKELGAYPENIFKSFNGEAFAAASIGQVHTAVLPDGRKAAVKIQYPNVRETIHSDLVMAKTLIKRIVKNPDAVDVYFDEVRDTLLEETDYLHEGRQIEEFRRRFGSETVIIPEWIREFSTERILCMTFIEGKHLAELLQIHPTQKERNRYGQLLWDFFHEEIRVGGYVHADTHPGNFLFTPDGNLGVIDFGCVKKFPYDFFMNYLRLLPAHLKDDREAIRDLFVALNIINPDSKNQEIEDEYYNFARNYGIMFSKPYREKIFDFNNPDYEKTIRHFTSEAPLSNELRGNKHFLYTSRVHTGLYHILIKLGAQIDTTRARQILGELLGAEFAAF